MNTRTLSNTLIRGENASWITLAKIGMLYEISAVVVVGAGVAPCAIRLSAGCGRPSRSRSAGMIGTPGGTPAPEQSLGLDGIVSAVAPWVAPQQTPPSEHQTPKYAVPADRFQRIARARRLVLAASRDRRRD